MTTVTEAIKHIARPEENEAFRDGDLEKLCNEPRLAQRLAQRLVQAAGEIAPGRQWTTADLRDVLEVAVSGVPHDSPQVVEGRYFRKRLQEHATLAERYRDSFGTVVIKLSVERESAVYSSVLDAVTENLRRSDLVFLYRRRLALVLPRMRAESIGHFLERVCSLVAVGPGEDVIEEISSLVYPHEDVEDAQAVLDWAEDQLRNDP